MENVQPHIAKQVGKEIQEILQSSLEGIQLVVNDQDVTDIQALIEGPPGTPYSDGQFRVKLHLTSSYPREPPKGFFLTKIFHPNIAPSNGEICVNTMKKDWKADLGIKHLLLTIKCLLIVPNAESALNEQAGKLLLDDYTEYARRARLFTEIHARVSSQKQNIPQASTSQQGILRDTNNGDVTLTVKKPSASNNEVPLKKNITATKKALKRL